MCVLCSGVAAMEYEDDFERQFAEELEVIREQEEGYGNDAPSSRRALPLASPFLPPGASRKRPIEESPLPLVPSDIDDSPCPPKKAHKSARRAAGVTTPLTAIPEHEPVPYVSSHTPVRSNQQDRRLRNQVLSRETDSGSVSRNKEEADGECPYSPPSPYSLPSSPSPPHSPTYGGRPDSVGHSPKRRKTEDLETSGSLGAVNSQRKEMGSYWSSPMKTPSRSNSRAEDHLTPTPTPPSASRYKRALDPSQLEPGHANRSMDHFEEMYWSLKTTPPGEVTSGALGLKPSAQTEDMDELYDDPYSSLATNPGSQSSHPLTSLGPLQHSHVLTRAPPGLHITVTSSDGARVYLRVKPGSKYEGRGESSQQSMWASSNLQLLSVPFARLRDSVEEERRRRLIEQSKNLLQSLRSDVLEEDSQLLFGDSEDQDAAVVEGAGKEAEHFLWVDKYSPRHFTELLSDDGINRTLLSWLKLWDECVFGRSSLLVGAGKGGPGKKKGEEKGQLKGAQGKNFEKKVEYMDPSALVGPEALDETRRPKLKIVLLCGAPGLGKTTLAHIIAKHAGYNVVEMNASDDRSPEVFHQRIQSSTQMQAVLTPDSRPNCLILDEIDGAPSAAIDVLINLLKRKETSKKKKKGGGGILSRPIICICNDQYAPSLRQLRQHALVLFFPPTVTSRLAGRLLQVSKKEHMTAAMSTMMALCEKSDNDIRSCLNTLQFIHRNQKDVTLAAVQSASVGQKDAQRSLFSLWKEIFQLPSGKKRHTLNRGPLRISTGLDAVQQNVHAGSAEGYLGTNAARFYHILSATTATGEYEKVAQGLFENYLHIKFKDPNLEAISLAQDWTVFHDTLQRHISNTQDYHFYTYLPFLSVAFHFLFAAPSRPQIRYPHTSFEVFQRHQKSSHLLSSLMAEVPPQNRRTISTIMLAVEILPPLTEIISPVFRPVSTQLYTAREKQQLADLVDTMISYNLTYHQERGLDGQYTYILDPNVEELCRFPGLPQKKQLTYSAKQLIAREVSVEKMRRAERALSGKSEVSAAMIVPRKNAGQDHKSDITAMKKPIKQIKPVEIKEEMSAMDFFGRTINSKTTNTDTVKKLGCHSSTTTHPLWFRFNEGFSNAVRRPVRIQDLL